MREPIFESMEEGKRPFSAIDTIELIDISNGRYVYVPEEGSFDEGICRAIAAGMVRERSGI